MYVAIFTAVICKCLVPLRIGNVKNTLQKIMPTHLFPVVSIRMFAKLL
jgi:hypothetical protein